MRLAQRLEVVGLAIGRHFPDETPVLAMVGVPGSGRSVIAKHVARRSGRSCELISSDAIRCELGGGSDPSLNQRAFDRAYQRLADALLHGVPVIWDATNSRRRERSNLTAAAQRHDVEVMAVHAQVTIEVAKGRIRGRERQVSDDVIRSAHRRLAGITTEALEAEGFARAVTVSI